MSEKQLHFFVILHYDLEFDLLYKWLPQGVLVVVIASEGLDVALHECLSKFERVLDIEFLDVERDDWVERSV